MRQLQKRLLLPDDPVAAADTTRGVIAVVSDLIFETRMRTTAEAVGGSFRAVRTPDQLSVALDQDSAGLVIVDLETSGDWAAEAVAISRCHPARPPVLAYCPHVRRDLAEAATQAGADMVLSRAQFSERLPELMQEYVGTRSQPR